MWVIQENGDDIYTYIFWVCEINVTAALNFQISHYVNVQRISTSTIYLNKRYVTHT